METRIISVREEQIEEKDALLLEAGEILKNGGLVAFPTETVYGLGGDGLNKESSRKIYAAKGRPSDNPLIIHIADMEALPVIVKVTCFLSLILTTAAVVSSPGFLSYKASQ